VGPRAGLDGIEKLKFLTLPGLELVVEPVASRYTDYATAASQFMLWNRTVGKTADVKKRFPTVTRLS
jgi:hypothetical protein